MTCLIVDDELAARTIVAHLCSGVKDLEVVAQFSNAIEAIKFLNEQNVDIVFLDIHMPEFSGMDFVQTLKTPPLVVMITSDTKFAVEAYEYEAIVDYLVKPIGLERFEKAMDKIKKRLSENAGKHVGPGNGKAEGEERDLFINIDRRLIKLKFDEILMIEAKADYIDIKTEKKTYHVHTTLKKVKDKLPESLFLQVHRSYIINFGKIIDIEGNSVLIGRDVIPISRSNRPELIRRLNLL